MTNDREERENRAPRPSNQEMHAEPSPEGRTSPVDPERLAALIEGRLTAEQRTALLGELDASPEALEAYADAVYAVRELEGDGKVLDVQTSLPRRSARSAWTRYVPTIAVAAAILIAVALPLARRAGVARLDESAVIAGALGPVSESSNPWPRVPWSEQRGPSDALSPRARAVRIGARIVDLDLLARAGDTSASSAALQVAALLDGVPAGGVAAAAYRALGEQDTGSAQRAALGTAASLAEQVAGEAEVRAGAWLEAARVAALQQDTAFFTPSRTRAAERAISALPGFSPDGRSALAELTRLLGASPRDWAAIGTAIDAVLREAATG